jgi:periplasmic protein TonB
VKRAPRLLLIAFALSLLVHVVVALVLRPPLPTPENQTEVVSIVHRPATIAVRAVPRLPPPRPKQTPAPRTQSSAPPARKGPGTAAPSSGRSAAPAPAVAASATPQPVATARAGCAQPNTGAAVVSTPAPPEIATEARAAGTSGTALVSVQLDSMGQVANASVTQSSGNSSLDLVAVSMARDARYTPALRDCKPVASAYTFSVKFVAW